MAKIGVAVVGTGHRGPAQAAKYAAKDNTDVVAVCDVVPELAEKVAAEYGVKAYTSVEELVKNPAVDAVDVVTPSVHHAAPAITAAEAGKHVMVATPFAVTLDECDRMIAAADKTGVNLMFAQTWRFNPSDRKAKQLLDAGEIGELIWISWTRMKPPYGSGPDRWFRWRSSGGGFWVWEGTHFTDQIRWFAGDEFSQAYSAGMGNYVSTGDGEDNGIGAFKFKDGVFAVVMEGNSDPGASRGEWRFVGTKGMIEATSDEVRLGKGGWQTVDIDDPDGDVETDEFVASIIEGRQPIMTGQDGRASLEAVLALHKSQETGLAIDIPMAWPCGAGPTTVFPNTSTASSP